MVEIISKRDGPRREDVAVRQLIEQNRATITRIADHISAGGYSAGKARRTKAQPQPDGLIIHVGGGAASAAEAKPGIRISLNGRVVAVDENSGRQMHHIGELRQRAGSDVFVLATRANGFFSPLDEEIAAALAGLDGVQLDAGYGEEQLAADIGLKLGMA